MSHAPRRSLGTRLIDGLPGTLFVLAGAGILAVVWLGPAWLEHHEVAWRLSVMRAQAEAMEEQATRHDAFAAAVAADDPVVLERLALAQLRETPEGKEAVVVRPRDERESEVGTWLAVAQPVVGRDVPAYHEPRWRVLRLATGPARWGLLVVGCLFMVGGVFYQPREADVAAGRR